MPDIPVYALYVMASVLIILILASIIVGILKLKNPSKSFVELRLRIQSWWVMVGLLFGALVAGNTASLIFLGFLSFMAFKEFMSIVPTRQADRRVVFFAYLSIPIQYYLIHLQWYGMFIIFIPVYVFLFLPIVMVLVGETKGFIRAAGTNHWAVMLTVFFLSHIAYLLVLPVKNESAGEIGLVLFLLVMTQLNDVCQFLWGKGLGGAKIIPKVSPNKTWAGFWGGVVTITIISGFLAPYLTPMDFLHGIFAGALIGVGGFIGDVVMSSVKRDLQIKDSSRFIPGHGGILDRMDSLLYTSPLYFHYLHYFYY